MSLRSIYEKFLASPNPLSLSENASLHYITTLTSFNDAGPIVRHLESQNKSVVRKKSEKLISAVEGSGSLALEAETTVEFMSDGGAYLPGLDNFVTDKIVTLPVVCALAQSYGFLALTDRAQTHFVQFDRENKIQQIRLTWDQGSLLKQVDVIGSRGKNWPICDGTAQVTLIKSTSSTVPVAQAPTVSSPRGREMDTAPAAPPSRSMSPNKKHIKDPHASLDLFGPVKGDENRSPASMAVPIAPRALIRPAQRDMSELFAAGHDDYEPSAENGGSPKKEVKWEPIAPKGAGSRNFQASRLFDDGPDTNSPAGYKSDPSKYNHFSIGEEDEDDPMQHKTGPKATHVEPAPLRAKTNKHLSQWDFKDFVTPEKHNQKVRSQDVRNFGWSDDEGETFETPGKHAGQPKPRKDAETHFELKDDGTPAPNRVTGPPRAGLMKKGASLYESHLYGNEDQESDKKPLGTITNNVGRKGNIPHWQNTDVSPERKANDENKPVGQDVKKHVQMMSAGWDTYDESPEQLKKPAGQMRRGQETHWGFTGEDEVPVVSNGGKRQEKNFWDF